MNTFKVGIAALVMVGCAQVATADEEETNTQAGIVGGELSAIANQLALKPEMAIDFTGVSGEYCFNGGLGEGAHMTHYAVDPTKTQEDVIDFINAQMLIEAGIDVTTLPRQPGTLRSMEPNKWYYLPAGEYEPHHGLEFDIPLLIRATDLK